MANILLLGDITGKSCVAVRMMTRTLEARGHEVFALPTALISNTLNLGRAQILDTTDYLLRSLELWETLGMRFDMVSIGFVTGLAQAKALCAAADRLRKAGACVLVDPILGDRGQKYNSITDEQVEGMRLLASHADIVMPNLTEAVLLTGSEDTPQQMARTLAQDARSVLITSCPAREGQGAIVGYDANAQRMIDFAYDRVPGHHFGTGDLFSAILIDALSRECGLEEAARIASDGVAMHLRQATAHA